MGNPKTFNFTQLWVQSVSVEKGREVYHDTHTRGLGLRVSSKKKVWQVLYRVKGDPIKKVKDLGEFPPVNLKTARAMAQAILSDAGQGHEPEASPRSKSALTFKDLATDYLERHAKAKKRTWEEDERILEKDLLPAWQNRKAVSIKRRDVIALLDEIADRGAPIAANRTLALARKIFNWAISRDLLESNPCLQVKPVGDEQQRDRVLTETEIRAAWKAFDGMTPRLMGLMFQLRFLTAQRGGEVESMAWKDVDLEAGWWTIPSERAKNGLSHRVPLAPQAVSILKELQALSGNRPWVFPSPRKTIDDGKPVCTHIANVHKAAGRAKDAIKKELGLKPDDAFNFVMHDLRRTAASYMASSGVPRLTISKVLNHVEQGVTRVYDRHSYDREKREALESWASRLQEILSTASTPHKA